MTVEHQLKTGVMCLIIAGGAALYLVPSATTVETTSLPGHQAAVQPERRQTAAPAPNSAIVSTQTTALARRLAELEQRVGAMSAEPLAPDSKAKRADDSETSPAPASGPDLGAWMTEAIRGEEWDRKRTEEVEDELASALARVPNLSVENVECGRRFCSGTFSATDGRAPAVAALWGLPPLDGEGFTRTGPAREVSVYFAKPGESLDRVQQEATLAAR
jgi:hypothetical protein